MSKSISALILAIGMLFASPAAGSIKLPWQKSKTQTKQAAKPAKAQKAKVGRDVQRLESILANVRTNAKLSDKSWKSVTKEADMLAIRIYANVKSATKEKNPLRAAEQLRAHVQNMRKEADKRDYKSTRRHAERALSVAAQLDEWSS